jgi:hypothetical protein
MVEVKKNSVDKLTFHLIVVVLRTGHKKIPVVRWACLIGCQGQLAVAGTAGLLWVQSTGCAARHRPKTSGISCSE